jgi:two-component system sensor histidine kinase MtrB
VTLRRRLTIVLALAVGLSGVALAAGSYLVVRHNLLADSVDSSIKQTRTNIDIAPTYLRQPHPGDALLQAYIDLGFTTVVVRKGNTLVSRLGVNPRAVPSELRDVVRQGNLGYQRTTISGSSYLVTGAPVGADTQAYFFFSEAGLQQELTQLGNILLAGVAILVLLAGLVGVGLARRTLRPVGQASVAAQALAEGLLDTRLPVEGKDEFGTWASSFNEMAAALETKISALAAAEARERRFTANVAHELRTPLTALVGEASLLSEHLDDLPPAARRPAELLVADIGRFRRLVEELMEISRFDAGAESVQAEPVDLGALAGAIARARGLDVAAAGEVVVASDPRRIERVVANLVDNAMEHGEGPVEIRVSGDGTIGLVEVADRGPGIPPEHVPNLFDRFYKADSARGGGAGLGLAIAQENAHLLGGTLEVASTPGEGTRFTLRIPVAEPLHDGRGAVTGPEHHDDTSHEGGRHEA